MTKTQCKTSPFLNRSRFRAAWCGTLAGFAAIAAWTAQAQPPVTPPMPIVPAVAVMPEKSDVLALMRRTADYQLDLQSRTRHNNNWIRATFYTGVLAAYRTTGDAKYKDAAVKWAEASKWLPSFAKPRPPRVVSPATTPAVPTPVTTPPVVPPAAVGANTAQAAPQTPTEPPKPKQTGGGEARFADNEACIQVYAELYEMDKDPARIAPSRAIMDAQIATPKPGRLEWWWCDALFMAPPGFARMARVTGDSKYTAFLHDQYADSKAFLYDPSERLFFRDKSYFQSKTASGKKVFWSRGNGWVFAGLARVIDYLPQSDPKRAEYVSLFRDMAARLKDLQQADGVWRSSLLDMEQFPVPEASGTAFFTYGMAWGVQNGVLDRATYLPVAEKGWAGLTHLVNAEGRLGYVQRVAGSPGATKPEDTHEYAVGALLLAGEQMVKLADGKSTKASTVEPSQTSTAQNGSDTRRFDFGLATGVRPALGFSRVAPETAYDATRGFGWLPSSGDLTARDRESPPGDSRRDFIVGSVPRTFRISGLQSGRYLLSVVLGDADYGDHETALNVFSSSFASVKPGRAEFATMSGTVTVQNDTLDLVFSTPDTKNGNWIVNTVTLAPSPNADVAPSVMTAALPAVERTGKDTWPDVLAWADPTLPLLQTFRANAKTASPIKSTGLTRADYLKLIAGEVDFWRKHQNANGAVIDPYRKVEFQYSTPAFAHAAAALVKYANRKDLVEPAAKALDWSAKTLSERKAASGHEDFFAPMIAHAIPLLTPYVSKARAEQWKGYIRAFDPYKTYRAAPGTSNWNIVALSGEARFQKMGLRPKNSTFVDESLAGQGDTFGSPYGLYLEGPLPYDHFPRLWAADMIAGGAYDGKYKAKLTEVLRRAAITSLFMQSPWGELPAGGRSAQHQWNEAEQCVTYEIYGAQAAKNKDFDLAAVYKRAAHLALASMFRWVRPTGEMQIVKNWVDPAEQFAYESYSAHSQYNLLPMSMLALAYEYAAPTEKITEKPAPADVGGFVLPIESLHKIFANAGGMYVEIDTQADQHYDATGLIRVQSNKISPQLGTSDSLVAHPSYKIPAGSNVGQTTGIGVSWQDKTGAWRRIGEMDAKTLTRVTVEPLNMSAEAHTKQTPRAVSFRVRYEGDFGGPSAIVENYRITPANIELTTLVENYSGPLRYVWPVLTDDGKDKGKNETILFVEKGRVIVRQSDSTAEQTFWPMGAKSVLIAMQSYANHNGWAHLAVAEYSAGSKSAVLFIAPQAK